MATTYEINGSLKVLLNMALSEVLNLSSNDNDLSLNNTFSFGYGTDAEEINIVYQDKITLNDAADITLNLYDSGTLKDTFGELLTLTAVKLILIKNNSADATLLIGGGNSLDVPLASLATAAIKVPPGGVYVYTDSSAAGLAVNTNKNLKLTHDGTGSSSMAVDIVIGGLD
jgi:hypothetical protein